MSEKSYVSLEQKMCLVTGKPYDTNSILLDKRMKDSLEKNTITRWGFCPEVEEKFNEGYIALVAVDLAKSNVKNKKIMPEDAWRTGNIAYLRRSVAENILTDFPSNLDWIFVDDEFIEKLASMQQE